MTGKRPASSVIRASERFRTRRRRRDPPPGGRNTVEAYGPGRVVRRSGPRAARPRGPLGIRPDQVLAHGLVFTSAGTTTLSGMPASDGSIEAAAEVELDVSEHESTQLSSELIEHADRIFCLSESHRTYVLHADRTAEAKTELLDPAGKDVPDPFGGDQEVYRETRTAIENLVGKRVAELLADPAG